VVLADRYGNHAVEEELMGQGLMELENIPRACRCGGRVVVVAVGGYEQQSYHRWEVNDTDAMRLGDYWG
jgi:hypothetical protein